MRTTTAILIGLLATTILIPAPALADHVRYDSEEACTYDGEGEKQVCFKATAWRSASLGVSMQCRAYEASTLGELDCTDSRTHIRECDWPITGSGCTAGNGQSEQWLPDGEYTVTATACVGPYANMAGSYVTVGGVTVGTPVVNLNNQACAPVSVVAA